MLTVPPMLPSSAEACADFRTSAPVMRSAGRMSKANSRPSSSVARMRLLRVTMLYCAPRPRTPTYRPSPPVVRVMETPVMWRSESATSSSGKRPSSIALIESTTISAFCFSSSDFPRLARIPVTTTVSSFGWSLVSEALWPAGVSASTAPAATFTPRLTPRSSTATDARPLRRFILRLPRRLPRSRGRRKMNLRRGRASVAVLLLGVSLGVNVAAGAVDADTPAGQSASDTSDQPKLETVVVTGIRASLGKSLEEKQNAEIVVDSINAIELGRFPDDDVADSLRHITGVSITRTTGGEGLYVGVRGLGAQYNIVTLNNRILATDDDGREFAFDILPADLITGADVRKSAQASALEGSIGGTVNMRTLRPLAAPGLPSAVRLVGNYNDMSVFP